MKQIKAKVEQKKVDVVKVPGAVPVHTSIVVIPTLLDHTSAPTQLSPSPYMCWEKSPHDLCLRLHIQAHACKPDTSFHPLTQDHTSTPRPEVMGGKQNIIFYHTCLRCMFVIEVFIPCLLHKV